MRALAEALGNASCTTREIPMRYAATELLVTLSGRASLAALARDARRHFRPPWPEVVLTAGRRNEASALHIGKASGGKTKIVHLGRPWHHPDRFDLVLFSTQYALEPGKKRVQLHMPLKPTLPRLVANDRFNHLPRPYLALLIGGNSGALTLDDRYATRLVGRASQLAGALSGSLLVSTSARTPTSVDRHLRTIPVAHHLWRWGESDNPYADYLASADAVIVTCDSASMLSDALGTQKPVLIFDFNDARWWRHPSNYRGNALAHRLAMRLAPKRMRRDLAGVMKRIVEARHAAWLVEGMSELPQCLPYASRDIDRATEAVKKLMAAR